MPRSAHPIPENESPRGRFRRLASQRTQRALDDLRKIGNLAQNPHSYEFDRGDVDRILDALKTRVAEVEAQFEAGLRRQERRGQGGGAEEFRL